MVDHIKMSYLQKGTLVIHLIINRFLMRFFKKSADDFESIRSNLSKDIEFEGLNEDKLAQLVDNFYIE